MRYFIPSTFRPPLFLPSRPPRALRETSLISRKARGGREGRSTKSARTSAFRSASMRPPTIAPTSVSTSSMTLAPTAAPASAPTLAGRRSGERDSRRRIARSGSPGNRSGRAKKRRPSIRTAPLVSFSPTALKKRFLHPPDALGHLLLGIAE